ncbi:MAG: tRNA (adenosine(37)-N6)-dimethylallyltransferase MiaA [Clostridia bacterium]|nr:tRNA (adenosine(37)-N6)-dimethylallyltransferase MiaA [Clostridia bacterium]
MNKKLIIICGPTASGKSALALKLAKLLDTEIISADSLAIYKRLDIGTAKPTIKEQSEVKHHLINVVEPTETFSVSNFEELALPIISDLLSRGKHPIICGGTGFYINSILYKLSYGNAQANLEVRKKYQDLFEKEGALTVYSELQKVDPESAKKLHANDVKRVIRALEIFYSTGVKKSLQNDVLTPRFDYVAVTPELDRQTLYNRIEKRVDSMISDGLISEVKGLISDGINLSHQSMQGIGYKETYDAVITGDYSSFIDLIKLNTRHYAKRQITFFKRLEGLKTVSSNPDIGVQEILSLLK